MAGDSDDAYKETKKHRLHGPVKFIGALGKTWGVRFVIYGAHSDTLKTFLGSIDGFLVSIDTSVMSINNS